jgi:hypothetical protein
MGLCFGLRVAILRWEEKGSMLVRDEIVQFGDAD